MQVEEIQNPPSIEALVQCFGRRKQPFLLDSALSNDGLGEWSFFGADPFEIITGKSGHYDGFGARVDGLALLRERMGAHQSVSHPEIPFIGGGVGFLAYDYGRQIESIEQFALDDRDIPDLHFGLYDGIAALNHKTGVLYLVALGFRASEEIVLKQLRSIIQEAPPLERLPKPRCGQWDWNYTREEFIEGVDNIKALIGMGEVYQVNLSRRARCQYEGDPLQLYAALRLGNPAPFGAYLDTGALQVFSTSPEQFLRKRGRSLMTRPIKGTRPRSGDPRKDRLNAKALMESEKERAELLMIVDLERNDLGRVAEFGSVKVEQLYYLENYARVMHQTAQVSATLAQGKDVFDCIHAIFPGGSITGAPKVSAMQIIERLEPTRRGLYCGSVGYIGFNGDAELNIAIRSLHLKDGYLDYQVGGGIVWDSIAASEYQETLDKGCAIRETIDALCLRS
ncbi:MAG: aminodeoxychorismate synthase, component I [Puniceicoccaceae bacterium MED-G31]|nr:MAG: aminodeoxychorismate synthase, component I [Puniceicoccaceae bacterium MED-G31]